MLGKRKGDLKVPSGAEARKVPRSAHNATASTSNSSSTLTASVAASVDETDDEGDATSQKKKRNRVDSNQLAKLEAYFKEDRSPTPARRKFIADHLGMPERQTQIWFQNRRAKAKFMESRAKDEGGFLKPIPPPKTPPPIGEGSKPTLQDMLNEKNMIYILPSTSISVGDWIRIKNPDDESDLITYFCEARNSFTWFVHAAPYSFKMEFSAEMVKNATLRHISPGHGAITFELLKSPHFYMNFRLTDGTHEWRKCADWTEDSQATHCLHHELEGPAAPLAYVLRDFHRQVQHHASMRNVKATESTDKAPESDSVPYPPSCAFSMMTSSSKSQNTRPRPASNYLPLTASTPTVSLHCPTSVYATSVTSLDSLESTSSYLSSADGFSGIDKASTAGSTPAPIRSPYSTKAYCAPEPVIAFAATTDESTPVSPPAPRTIQASLPHHTETESTADNSNLLPRHAPVPFPEYRSSNTALIPQGYPHAHRYSSIQPLYADYDRPDSYYSVASNQLVSSVQSGSHHFDASYSHGGSMVTVNAFTAPDAQHTHQYGLDPTNAQWTTYADGGVPQSSIAFGHDSAPDDPSNHNVTSGSSSFSVHISVPGAPPIVSSPAADPLLPTLPLNLQYADQAPTLSSVISPLRGVQEHVGVSAPLTSMEAVHSDPSRSHTSTVYTSRRTLHELERRIAFPGSAIAPAMASVLSNESQRAAAGTQDRPSTLPPALPPVGANAGAGYTAVGPWSHSHDHASALPAWQPQVLYPSPTAHSMPTYHHPAQTQINAVTVDLDDYQHTTPAEDSSDQYLYADPPRPAPSWSEQSSSTHWDGYG